MNNAEQQISSAEPIGRATMSSALPSAVNYHRYLYNLLQPYLKGKIWELGCGYGQYTDFLIEDSFKILATDIEQSFLDDLKNKYAGRDVSLEVEKVDLYSKDEVIKCRAYNPDTVLSLNVLEHIADDNLAISTIAKEIPSVTRVVFLVPAMPQLYGFMDSEAGHHRRYTRKSLENVFINAGFKVLKSSYTNALGAAGWFVRNRVLPPTSNNLDDPKVNNDIALFDKYGVPLTKLIDPLFNSFFGQSAIVVAER